MIAPDHKAAHTQPLVMRNVRVLTDTGRVLLAVPALDLPPGTALGIRGPSGAGKSTFLHAIAGLLSPREGEIIWGDTVLTALSSGACAAFRRHNMGLIFQDFLLFEELSAADNAALATFYGPRERVALWRKAGSALLTSLGLGADRDRRVDSFSGGERQRVAVARALAHDPAIVLADEPTASLDRASGEHLIADLLRLVREDGKTLVAVSHDEALLAQMDRVLHLQDGQIVEEEAV